MNTPVSSFFPYSPLAIRDRKSTRLNSSHSSISYAVFCLKKKTAHTRRDVVVPRMGRRHRSGSVARDEDLTRGGEAPARGRVLGQETRLPRDDKDRNDDLQR